MAMEGKHHRTKYAYGIACCRINSTTNLPEILLIQKRSTHAFVTFILSCNIIKNREKLRKLFDNMTLQEKRDILSLDYDTLWTRITRIPNKDNDPSDSYSLDSWSGFMQRKIYFETTYKQDIRLLQRLMSGTRSILAPWDIPKGRRKKDTEKNFDVALREFSEETGGTIANITPFLQCTPIVSSYIDSKCLFYNTFFIAASADPKWNPVVTFNDNDTAEIQDIQWFSIARLKALDNAKHHMRLVELVSLILTKFKKGRLA
jgi:8-oxo-dGTP pyrophosphatase MutT (NUDIX family)